MEKIKLLVAALAIIVLPAVLFAAGIDKIASIEVTGNEKIDSGFIMNTIKSKENDTYDIEKVRDDLKSIYKTGFFSDVQIDVKDSAKGKIVTFIVIERPTIKNINIKGNKKVKTPELTDKLKVRVNTVLNIEKIKESMDELKKLYSSKGYYTTKVSYEIVYGDAYDATVNFAINEPEQAFIKAINLSGNKALKTSYLKGFMQTKERTMFSWFTGSGILDEDTLEEDRKNLEAIYYDQGYVRVNIGVPDIALSKDGKSIIITIPITEGNVYKLGTVDVEGDMILPKDKLLAKVKSKTGATFRNTVLHEDILALTDLYQDGGYAFCEITPLTAIDDNARVVNLSFKATKNQEVYFNRINILGNTKTRDKVIRRELKFAEGDRFSATALKDSKRKVKNTTFFKDVDMKIIKTEDPNKVNVDLTVEERPTGSISFGIGYSTSENAIISGSIEQDNFLGTGRKIMLDASLGGSTQQFRLSMIEPYVFDKNLSAGYNLFNYERSMDSYDYKKLGGGVSLTRPLTDYTKIGTKYRFEQVEVYNLYYNVGNIIRDQEGTSTTSAMGFFISKNTIDDVMNPTKGDNGEFSVELAGGLFGGSNDFVSIVGSYGRYFPVKFMDSAFFIKGTAGTIQGYGNKQIPIYEKFYVGGLNSIRGFKYGEAGPLDDELSYLPMWTYVPAVPATATKPLVPAHYAYMWQWIEGSDEPIGAENEVFFNFEWIFPISKAAGVKGVLFSDIGCGFDHNASFRLRKAAGFGIRWLSPMGPLRLEFGFNLEPKSGERGSAFEFAIGTQY